MENKIFIDINCPGCNAVIKLGKAPAARSLSFRCPKCQKIVAVNFNTAVNPQTFTAAILTPEQLKQMQIMQQAKQKLQQQPVQKSAQQHGPIPVNPGAGTQGMPHVESPVKAAAAQPLSGATLNKTIYGNRNAANIPSPGPKKPLQPHKTTPAMRGLSLVRQSLLFWNKVSYPLILGNNYIGRRNGNIRPDISIDEDDCISRGKSVNIEITPGGANGMTMTVKVIHSSNDVVINSSMRLRDNQSMEVRIGDQIKIGKTTFKIEKQE